MDIANVLACQPVNWMEQESAQLARGLKQRDPDVLDRLIEQYQFRLFRYLVSLTGSRQTAEDLFQETWLRVLERGHQYSAKWKFEAWLFSIARHLVIDFLRRKKPASLEALTEPDGQSRPLEFADPAARSPFDVLSGCEEGERLAWALTRLAPAFREVLLLRFQEDLKLEEIAAIVDIPLSTVKSRLYRGLDELKNLMEEAQA